MNSTSVYVVNNIRRVNRIPVGRNMSFRSNLSGGMTGTSNVVNLATRVLKGVRNVAHRRRSTFTLTSRRGTRQTAIRNCFSSRVLPVRNRSRGNTLALMGRSRIVHPRAALRKLTTLQPTFSPTGNAMATNDSSTLSSNTSTVLVVDRRGTGRLNLAVQTGIHSVTISNYSPSVVNCKPIPTAGGTLGQTNLSVSRVSLFRLGRTFTTRSLPYVGSLNLVSIVRRGVGLGNKTVTLKRPLNYSKSHVTAALVGGVRHANTGLNITAVYVNLNRNVTAMFRHP